MLRPSFVNSLFHFYLFFRKSLAGDTVDLKENVKNSETFVLSFTNPNVLMFSKQSDSYQ